MKGYRKHSLLIGLAYLLVLSGCARTVHVQDNDGNPISGVKVTLESEGKVTTSFTNLKGNAKLDSEHSKERGIIKYEKEGYNTESYGYPGGKSLIENLDPVGSPQ